MLDCAHLPPPGLPGAQSLASAETVTGGNASEKASTSAPPRDVLAELRQLRTIVAKFKSEIAGETRAREGAEAAHRAALARADRAEHAERQTSADRDRWRRLALEHEAELRSLQPVRLSE
ncbi:MAG TPA: hypothetical protein VGC77_09645 [Rhodopseudomonas sp.]|uniref:hypothetical protein n=1 Tax=Rhodopseudomonas sp. TaxID=1078 RepID=UPI002EDB62BE